MFQWGLKNYALFTFRPSLCLRAAREPVDRMVTEKHNCLNFGLYTLVISIVCLKRKKPIAHTLDNAETIRPSKAGRNGRTSGDVRPFHIYNQYIQRFLFIQRFFLTKDFHCFAESRSRFRQRLCRIRNSNHAKLFSNREAVSVSGCAAYSDPC